MDANTVPDRIYVLFLMFFNGLNQNPDFGSEPGEGEQSPPPQDIVVRLCAIMVRKLA